MRRRGWLSLWIAVSALAAEKGYVDPETCRGCHTHIYDTYSRTGMGRSFGAATQDNVPALADFFHALSGRRYSIGAGLFLRRTHTDIPGAIEKSIDFVIGSGNHSKTFAHRDASGRLYELPVSWYADRGGYYAMSPGYDRADHSDFRREVSDSCLFCHNGYPSEANRGLAMGIDCQRCHGPGELHAASKGGIVNPAKLSRARQMDVCLQCHLESASRTLPEAIRKFGRGVYSYRPGEPLADYKLYFEFADARTTDAITVNNSGFGLLQSACFRKSEMTCTTCHDPHMAYRGAEAEKRYTATCRTCHAATHKPETTNCAGCHMPKRRTEDAVHVVMTDHRIQRRPSAANALEPRAEKHDKVSGAVRLLYPASVPNTPENAVYLAMAQADIPALEKAIRANRPSAPEPYRALAEAYKKAGRIDDAIQNYRSALARNVKDASVYVALAELLSAKQQISKAMTLLERGSEVATDVGVLNALAVIYVRQGRYKDALGKISEALRINNDDPMSWLNFGVCLQATGDKKGAEAAYRQAMLLQPDLGKARDYLKLVLEN